jgi:hypothetical protein
MSRSSALTVYLVANTELRNVKVQGTDSSDATVTLNGLTTARTIELNAQDSTVELRVPKLGDVRNIGMVASNQATVKLVGSSTKR